MKTISPAETIKNLPFPLAKMDCDFKLIETSEAWDKAEKLEQQKSERNQDFTLPLRSLKELNDDCLKNREQGEKIIPVISEEGLSFWYRWQVNPYFDEDGKVLGTYILREDVTKQVKKEQLLIKAQEVTRIGGWEVDLIQNTVYWTKVTKEIHEVPMDYIPNLEEGINFYKAGEDRERITELVSKAISDGSPWDTELRIVTAKGRELWVHARGEVEILKGKAVRITGTFQDIDQKKKADLAYKKISERLSIATEASGIGIWDLNLLTNSLEWDKNMYQLYGIKENDFSGVYDAWESAVHPDDKEKAQIELQDAIQGTKDFNTEFRIVYPSGEIRYIRAFGVIRRNAEGIALNIIGTNWDITELKKTRLELDKSEESFEGAFEHSTTGMALVSLEGNWIKVNQNLCEITGYSEEELMKINYLDLTHPEDRSRDLLLRSEVLEGKRKSYQTEKRYYHKKGHLIHLIVSVTGVKNIYGELSHVISQILDVSKLVKAEKHLKSLVQITQDQNESLLNFAHIVSHNLRSHASNMTMLTDFLLKDNDPDELQNIGKMLKAASESLNETVAHLNEVVQVKAGSSEKIRPVALLKKINLVRNNINALLHEKNAECHIDIPKDLRVKAIPAYLESMFLNLFTNSLKYASPDRNPIIEIEVKPIKKGVCKIEFRDNGLGIDLKRHKDKVFGMYKTFHHNKDAKGIGLFITKNQVEAMNGNINVKSKVDQGTTFIIELNTI
ncbi:PAS domain-containing sensor histidine kinase [Muriicola soli]|uniref:histidine kinase n=1 Tax=Muriicola soli TaxID=2507538 RepID=A0A411ECK3_9FLAO|nr:PAS domain-containing sensor histidine kinase [Muriicola soli]QBA65187.1 PAS domain S-box protein [Muriicola soli]